MDENLITKICGIIPEGFNKVIPEDSSYIFQNDPNFPPINLYDFFGRAATVNSFTECFYYVELGFEPNKLTIFDIGSWVAFFAASIFLLFKFYKMNYLSKINNYIRSTNSKKINLIIQNKNIRLTGFLSFLAVQMFMIYDYVKTKSLRIPRFIDEYITLTSNVNFFNSFNFDAGQFLGGNYSVQITTGPISAVGSVIGWNITNKLIVSRISNFFWVLLLQTLFVFLFTKAYKLENKGFLYLSSSFILILIPWWQGSLYSIGEIPSSILFINGIFLFSKYRKFSLILFCLSIVYGKLLNFVPFVGFYLTTLFIEKNPKNILKDFSTFLLTLLPWLTLAHLKYENGNLIDYIRDQFNFIINHQSSGVREDTNSYFENFMSVLNASEFINWSTYEKIRILIIPIIFLVILIRNKEYINNIFGNITIPLTNSIVFIYLWFWVLNSTKWIRHTQHFTVLILISIVYLLNSDSLGKKLDIFILLSLITFFIDNNKNLIFFTVTIYLLFYLFSSKDKYFNQMKYLFIFILLFDISITYYENTSSGNINEIIEECKQDLKSDACRNLYLSG